MPAMAAKKLDFPRLRPLERRCEMQVLCDAFAATRTDGSAAVLLEAVSGTGKSVLLQSFLATVSPQALICYGKFEERTAASEPFAAIVKAMDALIEKILVSGEGHKWGIRIRESLDVEIDLLEDSFPSFKGISRASRRPSDSSTDSSQQSAFYFDGFGDMTGKEWRFERFRLAMRSLFRCLSSYAPVVFCLDDLHWVDPDSLALVRTLIADDVDTTSGRRFLFVGASRPLAEASLLLRQCIQGFSAGTIRCLTLPGLAVDEICHLVGSLLGYDDSEADQAPNAVRPLAQSLHENTGGNAFAVIHLLRRLQDRNLFCYQTETNSWTFDLAPTRAALHKIENPAQVVVESLEQLEASEKLALMVAASFGTSYFEVATIVHALDVLEPVPRGEESAHHLDSVDPFCVQNRIRNMKQKMHKLVEAGFVTAQETDGQFKFTHDSVREAAYSLLPEGDERKRVHMGIGRQLRMWMDMESELGTSFSHESMVLHAAKHLNYASDLIHDTWERVDLAELNYQAAELVAQKSSFFPALDYLQCGIMLLGEAGWKDHYALTQKLHVALTRIQYSLGEYDECLRTADDVLAHGRIFRDERAVYHTKLFCLMQQDRFPEALEVVFGVLKDLGQTFPRRFLKANVVKDYMKACRLLKGKADAELLALPRVEDEVLNDTAEFMERLAEISHRGVESDYFKLFALRCVHLTLERGLFSLSTFAFGAWAWTNAELGNHDEAVRFGKLAVQLADEGLGRHRDVRLRLVYWSMLFHWRQPYDVALVHMARELWLAWDYGAVDYVHWHGSHYIRLSLACGKDLHNTLNECEKHRECLVDYKQHVHLRTHAPFHQAILNLMGKSPDPSRLVGDVLDEETARLEWGKGRGDLPALQLLELHAMMVAYYFCDYDRAFEVYQKLKNYGLFLHGPDFWVTLRIFYSALVLIAKSRQRGYQLQRRKGKSRLRQLRMWADKGNVACKHMCLLLDAELQASNSSSDVDEVLSLYVKAGDAACQISMVQHGALAYELAGRFISSRGHPDMASMYLVRAVNLYSTWGATGKVNQIQSEHEGILSLTKQGTRLIQDITTELTSSFAEAIEEHAA
jgi:predicted ATPase